MGETDRWIKTMERAEYIGKFIDLFIGMYQTPTYSEHQWTRTEADRGIAALKLQMKELLGTK